MRQSGSDRLNSRFLEPATRIPSWPPEQLPFKGFSLRLAGQAEYIGRHRKLHGKYTPNSHFYLGLFASTWILDFSFLQDFIARLFALHPNKHSFYNQGLKAMSINQSAF